VISQVLAVRVNCGLNLGLLLHLRDGPPRRYEVVGLHGVVTKRDIIYQSDTYVGSISMPSSQKWCFDFFTGSGRCLGV
jgi:hypothetical protein